MDAIDWAFLEHAYGPATDTPGLIRDLCSDDSERVSAAQSELAGSIHHQGTVYPATVAAVPFLIDAALRARHERAYQVISIGMLADPHHSYGDDFPAVQAAVREHAGPLAALLHDDDDEVRAAVVYLAAQTGAVHSGELAELWESAEETQLRVALLFAFAVSDPMGSSATLRDALDDDEPEVRLAAALALQRAGLPWPDGAVEALVDVFEQEADLPYEWHAEAEPTTELVLNASDAVRDDLLGRLLQAEVPARETALWVLGELFRARRGARKRFVPLLGPLLADTQTCKAAVDLLSNAGRAAGRYRDELAAIAAGYPDVAASEGFTLELYAVQTLMRLGDPRWVVAACEGARAGGHHHIGRDAAPCNPETLVAVRARLDALPTEAVTTADRAELSTLRAEFARWGQAAAELAPRLRELVPAYGVDVAVVLAALGDDTAVVVGCLRAAAVDGGVAEAVSLWRITGEAGPVVAAVKRRLEFARQAGNADLPDGEPRYDVEGGLREAVPAGAHLRDLADDLRAVAAGEEHHLWLRLPATRLLWTGTGETEIPTAVVRQSLGNEFLVPDALELARLMEAHHLVGDVRALLSDDGRAGAAAARTLWAFGIPPDDLMPCLLGCLENGFPLPAVEALDLIVEMGHAAAVPVLRELAERDEALVTAGVESDIVWNDEELCDRLHAARYAPRPPTCLTLARSARSLGTVTITPGSISCSATFVIRPAGTGVRGARKGEPEAVAFTCPMQQADARTLIVTGVYGSGKTSVIAEMADILEKRGEPYAAVDLDWLTWFQSATGDVDAHQMMLRNLTTLVDNYRGVGVRRFLLAGFLSSRSEVDSLRSALAMPVTVVWLSVSADEIRRRLAGDPTSGRADDLRFAEQWLAGGTGTGEGLQDFSTAGDRPLREVATDILRRTGWM